MTQWTNVQDVTQTSILHIVPFPDKNGFIVCEINHDELKHIVEGWEFGHDSVLIDGAIVDPQFMEKTPVGLFCKSPRLAEWVKELIESKDLK
jgi:hypothetical protein